METNISNPILTLFHNNMLLFYLFIIWVILWKGFALWTSAQKNQKYWFILLLVINSGGILEILYLFVFKNMKFIKRFPWIGGSRNAKLDVEKKDKLIKNINNNKNISDKNGNVKNYSPIFWKYFWIGLAINFLSAVLNKSYNIINPYVLLIIWIIVFIVLIIYMYKFSKMIDNAMASVGRKNWWPLGLLAMIPAGFWVAFLIVRSKLKPNGKWISNKNFRLSKDRLQ